MREDEQAQFESRLFAAEIGDPPALDLHEMSDTHEGVRELGFFLSQQVFAGEETVRIIHGRGTGRMRAAVHAALEESELVPYFRDSHQPSELLGVTYAVLEKRS